MVYWQALSDPFNDPSLCFLPPLSALLFPFDFCFQWTSFAPHLHPQSDFHPYLHSTSTRTLPIDCRRYPPPPPNRLRRPQRKTKTKSALNGGTVNRRRPVRPGLNVFVEFETGALGGLELAGGDEHVIVGDVAVLDADPDQFLGGVDLPRRRKDRIESADEGDADALGVVAVHLGADRVPPPTLVRVAVAPDHEAVADVVPPPAVPMEGLDRADVERAGGEVGAVFRRRVHYYHVGHR